MRKVPVPNPNPILRGSHSGMEIRASSQTSKKPESLSRNSYDYLTYGSPELRAYMLGTLGYLPTRENIRSGQKAFIESTAPIVETIVGTPARNYRGLADMIEDPKTVDDFAMYEGVRALLAPLHFAGRIAKLVLGVDTSSDGATPVIKEVKLPQRPR